MLKSLLIMFSQLPREMPAQTAHGVIIQEAVERAMLQKPARTDKRMHMPCHSRRCTPRGTCPITFHISNKSFLVEHPNHWKFDQEELFLEEKVQNGRWKEESKSNGQRSG